MGMPVLSGGACLAIQTRRATEHCPLPPAAIRVAAIQASGTGPIPPARLAGRQAKGAARLGAALPDQMPAPGAKPPAMAVGAPAPPPVISTHQILPDGS